MGCQEQPLRGRYPSVVANGSTSHAVLGITMSERPLFARSPRCRWRLVSSLPSAMTRMDGSSFRRGGRSPTGRGQRRAATARDEAPARGSAAGKLVKGGVNLDHFGGAKVDQLVKGYNQRSRIETQMGRWKSVIGPKLKSRSFSRQITEIQLGRKVLNTMTALGRPVFERIA